MTDSYIQRGGDRLKCPKCGNNQRNKIREVDDKTHQIMDYPVLFAKKFICGLCGSEWAWNKEE